MREKFLQATLAANQEIYQKIQNGFKEEWREEYSVGAGGDVSSGFDLFCEATFVKHLKSFGKIESEESGEIGEGENTIIIDPLDGSSNALSNFPYYGSSVALLNADSLLEVAIVCNFANGDIFYKFANSTLNYGNLLRDGYKQELAVEKPKIGIFERAYAYGHLGKKLHALGIKYRVPGAVALSLAYAHRVDFVVYKGNIRIYDFAAALAFCEDLKVSISQDYVIVTHSNEQLQQLEEIMKEETV
jgi:myo-inositol-1(or 4)-monophosphatase